MNLIHLKNLFELQIWDYHKNRIFNILSNSNKNYWVYKHLYHMLASYNNVENKINIC